MRADQEKTQTVLNRTGRLVQIGWALSIMTIATVIGVYLGWESHGLGGAIGLGLAGLIIGGILSSPSVLFSLLS